MNTKKHRASVASTIENNAGSHAIRRRLGASKSASRLATSWLVRAFRKLLDSDEPGKQQQ